MSVTNGMDGLKQLSGSTAVCEEDVADFVCSNSIDGIVNWQIELPSMRSAVFSLGKCSLSRGHGMVQDHQLLGKNSHRIPVHKAVLFIIINPMIINDIF